MPDEIYNLGAQSHVAVSFQNPVFTTQVGTLGSISILEGIRNCEKDNKYMVVCDLTLLMTQDFSDASHSNVLIFDTKRKTIERFDPHGANEYSNLKLAYDTERNSTGRKDFKFGNNNNNKLKSSALFNQVSIDLKLKKYMKRVLPNYTYYGTNDTTPYLGPQLKADEYAGSSDN